MSTITGTVTSNSALVSAVDGIISARIRAAQPSDGDSIGGWDTDD